MFTKEFEILPGMVGFDKRLTLPVLFSTTIDASDLHAEQQGCSIIDLQNVGLSWVIIRLSLDVHYYPAQGEFMRISTWVDDCNRLYTTRRYKVETSDGKAVAEGVSYWGVIDFKERTSVNMLNVPILQKHNSMLEPKHEVDSVPERIRICRDEAKWNHIVELTDIDFNRHANSAHYISWLMNTYGFETIENEEVARLDINFSRETYLGRKINICRAEENGEHSFTLYEDGEDNQRTIICNAKLTWTKRRCPVR